MANITGITRGGKPYEPTFIVALNPENCLGCGRCFKVCPREVFELVERSEDDENYDEDEDNCMVMTLANALDCIGCGSCARVCPKQCQTHQPMALEA
jgi:Nif-specific ferredoxin III